MSRKLEKFIIAEPMLMDNTIGNSVNASQQIGSTNKATAGKDLEKTKNTELPSGIKLSEINSKQFDVASYVSGNNPALFATKEAVSLLK